MSHRQQKRAAAQSLADILDLGVDDYGVHPSGDLEIALSEEISLNAKRILPEEFGRRDGVWCVNASLFLECGSDQPSHVANKIARALLELSQLFSNAAQKNTSQSEDSYEQR